LFMPMPALPTPPWLPPPPSSHCSSFFLFPLLTPLDHALRSFTFRACPALIAQCQIIYKGQVSSSSRTIYLFFPRVLSTYFVLLPVKSLSSFSAPPLRGMVYYHARCMLPAPTAPSGPLLARDPGRLGVWPDTVPLLMFRFASRQFFWLPSSTGRGGLFVPSCPRQNAESLPLVFFPPSFPPFDYLAVAPVFLPPIVRRGAVPPLPLIPLPSGVSIRS